MPIISIKAETVFEILGFQITNSFLLALVVLATFTLIAITYYRESKSKKKSSYYFFVNYILKSIYGLFKSILKDKTDFFFPLIATFFLFILMQNWFGLLPGVGSLLIKVEEGKHIISIPLLRSNNADLNTTLVLALVSVILIQFFGIKYLGFRVYLKKFIKLSNPIDFFTGILDILSEFSRVISFSFRLYGNIFAGEVLLVIIAFLIPILASFPFLVLEIFVGFIQALVFSMLTAVFLSVAISKEH